MSDFVGAPPLPPMPPGWDLPAEETNTASTEPRPCGATAPGGVFTSSPGDDDGAATCGFDLTLGAADDFPIDLFPSPLWAVAEQMAKIYQTPVSLPAMSAIAAVSGATGKSVVARGAYKDKVTRLNVYVIRLPSLVAERATLKRAGISHEMLRAAGVCEVDADTALLCDTRVAAHI